MSSGPAASHLPPRCACTLRGHCNSSIWTLRSTGSLPTCPAIQECANCQSALGSERSSWGVPTAKCAHSTTSSCCWQRRASTSSCPRRRRPQARRHRAQRHRADAGRIRVVGFDGRRCRWHDPQAHTYGCGEK